MVNAFLAMGLQFMQEQEELQKKTEENLESIKRQYWEAVNLPRKSKKAIRKKLINQYKTLSWVLDYHKQMFNYKL